MDPYIGEIKIFAGNFAPVGYVFCNGQTLSIAQYQALFTILGTTYGGNGTTTFQVPDLQGRAPIHLGSGPGLTPRLLGQNGGFPTVTLVETQMPVHNHALEATTTTAPNSPAVGPANCVWAQGVPHQAGKSTVQTNLYTTKAPTDTMAPQALSVAAGGNQPHNNESPCLVLNFIIATEGIFPSRG